MDHKDHRALATIKPAEARARVHHTRDIRVSSPFIVQMAASHAGIGPYRTYFREGPEIATARYRAADMSDRNRN
jgi:hypothetical protein